MTKTKSIRITEEAYHSLRFLAAQTESTMTEAASEAIKKAWSVEAKNIQGWLDKQPADAD